MPLKYSSFLVLNFSYGHFISNLIYIKVLKSSFCFHDSKDHLIFHHQNNPPLPVSCLDQ